MRRRSWNSVRVFYPPFSREELLKLLRERSRILSERIPLVKVILFGSYAKGRQTPSSDVDVLIVHRCESLDVYSLAWDVLDIPQLQLHVYREEDYKRLRKVKGSLVQVAEREGVVVYP